MGIVDRKTRSTMMAGIKGKDTRPELVLRRALHAAGFRCRLRQKGLPGRPDMVFRRIQAVVFVHGCFWHRHEGCRFATNPATRQDFWAAKFEANTQRDGVVMDQLLGLGWRVAVVWECALKNPEGVKQVCADLSDWLLGDGITFETGSFDLLA